MASSDTYHLKLTFCISLTGIPMLYLVNYAFTIIDESVRTFWMMVLTFLVMGTVSATAYLASRVRDWVYFGMTVFAFTAVIDLVITLGFFEVIDPTISEYVKMGEPYLLSSWGCAICAYDAIGFYLQYLLIVHLYTNNRNWRYAGLYWAAAILNSMLVVILGVFIGKHSATFCTLVNIPYVVLPICTLFRIFKTQKRSSWTTKVKNGPFVFFLDTLLSIGFLASIWIILAKALSILGSDKQLIMEIVAPERALRYNDPSPFYSLQVCVYFFYLVPIQVTSLYCLIKREMPHFLWEATVAEAGIMLQAQISYIIFSLVHLTPAEYRVDWTNRQFWITNLLLVIIPHLFLARLNLHRGGYKTGNKKYK